MDTKRKSTDSAISNAMIEAGMSADILNRGKDADDADLVVEIFRAMEQARRSDHGVSIDDHPGP